MAKKTALIIEDDIKDIKKIEALLEARDIKCDFGTSALEAIIKLKKNSYAFLVLDLDLGTGIDEGKFLLDKMQQEKLFVPTIIVSRAGFLPEIMALRGRYTFVLETIDKEHLHEMLPVLDIAISRLNETSENEQSEDAAGSLVPKVETTVKSTSWSTEAKIAVVTAIVLGLIGIATIIVTVTVPEARRVFHLDASNENPQPTNENP